MTIWNVISQNYFYKIVFSEVDNPSTILWLSLRKLKLIGKFFIFLFYV